MCGILGYFSRYQENYSQEKFLKTLRMSNYRGPDYTGIANFENNRLLLGHNRLSILDLSELSHQPMLRQNGHYAIVFNGEIYNFQEIRAKLQNSGIQFATSGDTEVLLQSYIYDSINFLSSLDGMYAFAIYDYSRRKLILARDLAGEKPLFYYVDAKQFIFASELKQILSFPISRTLSMPNIDLYFSQGYLPSSATLIEGVKKLPPAHFLEFDLDTWEINSRSFWQVPTIETPHSEEESIYTLHKHLQTSISSRMIADTSLGAFLSGGIDSTLIASVMQEVSPKPIKTFCMGFENSKYNEFSHAKKVADSIGSHHTELVLSTNIGDTLEDISLLLDEPIFDNSIIPTFLLCKEAKQHVTVALAGDGGDELFGGYHHILAAQTIYRWQRRIPTFFQNGLHEIGRVIPEGSFGKKSLLGFGKGPFGGSIWSRQVFFSHEREELLNGQIFSEDFLHEKNKLMELYDSDFVNQMCYHDFIHYLPQILIKVDRASMMNSLEVRAPFLSKNLIEYSFKHIPGSLKIRNGIKKSVLKSVLNKYYPTDLDIERKQGFNLPSDLLMRSNFLLKFSELQIPEFLNSQYIDKIHQSQIKGKGAYWNKLFSIYMFIQWYHQWIE